MISMSDTKKYQCRYCKCIYGSRDIEPEDDVVDGKTHYHAKCLEYKNTIFEITDYYYKNVSKTVVFAMLVKVVDNIVFKKKVDPKYLLFALKYAVQHGAKIKSPLGLHYIIDNERIKTAYQNEIRSTIIRPKIKDAEIEAEQQFEYKPLSKTKGFGEILKK